MCVIDLTYRYFTLSFRCNGQAGQPAAMLGISKIYLDKFDINMVNTPTTTTNIKYLCLIILAPKLASPQQRGGLNQKFTKSE